MNDLVERMRALSMNGGPGWKMIAEAADRIEELGQACDKALAAYNLCAEASGKDAARIKALEADIPELTFGDVFLPLR